MPSTTCLPFVSHRAGAPSIVELLPLPDTHHISQVVAAIRNGEVKEGSIGADGKPADKHLRLPASMSWPIATNNVLFVRELGGKTDIG